MSQRAATVWLWPHILLARTAFLFPLKSKN